MSNALVSGQRAQHMPNSRDFGKYHDSTTFSDVTIKFGINGSQTFPGHKVVLCRKSKWFASAFENRAFKEAQSAEVILKDDNPDAFRSLLEFCYKGTYKDAAYAEHTLGAAHTILHHLHVMIVADKYLVDDLVKHAFQIFKSAMTQDPQPDVFAFVIEQVYNPVDTEHQEDLPLHIYDKMYALMKTIFYMVGMGVSGCPIWVIFPFSLLVSVDALPSRKAKPLVEAPPLDQAKSFLVERTLNNVNQRIPRVAFEHLTSLIDKVPAFGVDVLKLVLKNRVPFARYV